MFDIFSTECLTFCLFFLFFFSLKNSTIFCFRSSVFPNSAASLLSVSEVFSVSSSQFSLSSVSEVSKVFFIFSLISSFRFVVFGFKNFVFSCCRIFYIFSFRNFASLFHKFQ